ncbi:MAG: DNA topoisomerase, partial [Rikenellaceae bacterium]
MTKYKLVIAEKPSVAQSIAKVLGATAKKDGYFEGGGYFVSWCVGHLIALASTEKYGEKYGKWELSHLPIIPPTFEYEVSKGKEKQVKILCKLLNRDDVDCVINGCDAGREGELIFRLVYNFSKCDKPMERLWISSMEDSAIKDGFRHLQDGKHFDNLYNSALCRSRADWIVGINATRLFSCLYGQTLNVGRVMSPTLAMLVERNANIRAFVSEPFYNIILENDNIAFSSEKIKDKIQAELAFKNLSNKLLMVQSVESKEKSEKPPRLYDLTTLQREANRKLGFTATQTLEYVQSLYEKKLCTYPRTDSSFLTEDMADTLPDIIGISIKILQVENTDKPCNYHLVINNSKVTDHHAIIPTKSLKSYNIDNLPYGEKAVLTLIVLRLLSALGDTHKYCETVVTAACGDRIFKTKGKTIVADGFKQYARLVNADDEVDTSLPLMAEGEVIENIIAKLKEGKTSPPKQYTEDTLLSSMESAGQQ